VQLNAKAEVPGVEGDRLLNVIDYATHADRSHRSPFFSDEALPQ
jgi:hypothetical protein